MSTRPKRLEAGDTVAIIAPSSGLASVFPHIYERGLQNLQDRLGLKTKIFGTATMDDDTLYRSPQIRALDINRAFADPEVKAIITTIGGDDSVRILPYLDTENIRSLPKIIMGYSDASTFLTYLNQCGIVTFNGPAIMAGFAQLESLPDAFTEHIRTMLMTPFDSYEYTPYGVYTEGYADWRDPANVGKIKKLLKDKSGPEWIQGQGCVTGELFGGCIEVLEFMKGTEFWPEPEFWDGKVLFFETSEDVPTVDTVKYYLRNYGSQGILKRINGILFGRPRGYTAQQKKDLKRMIRKLLAIEFNRPDLPVVVNLDFGHTDPQWIMPNGVPIEIDCDHHTLRLVEACTQ